ncbi:CHAD domain-containing protein, partial [Streptomyces sp. NPDC058469]|uniref:CHAD domain-containing protein n=1 Tax=Streptomyces sp. NPDC058469 TaxID=3346514 RepID=UPI00366A2285
MAQQHLDPTDPAAAPVTGDALAGYLRAQATEFLRALRLHRETGNGQSGTEDSVDAARALRHSARRISGSLHTFRPLLDADWSEEMRPELAWLSGTLALEHACAARLERLLLALHRLSGSTAFPAQSVASAVGGRVTGAGRGVPSPATAVGARGPAASPTATAERGSLTVGAAKAGALLERQLTLA